VVEFELRFANISLGATYKRRPQSEIEGFVQCGQFAD